MKVMEELKQYHYDLVLLDIMLPGMSGYDICRRIRDEIDIPILMVTARAEAVEQSLLILLSWWLGCAHI